MSKHMTFFNAVARDAMRVITSVVIVVMAMACSFESHTAVVDTVTIKPTRTTIIRASSTATSTSTCTPQPTASATPQPSHTATHSNTPTAVPIVMAKPLLTDTPMLLPTDTPIPVPTATAIPPSPTAIALPTDLPTVVPTVVPATVAPTLPPTEVPVVASPSDVQIVYIFYDGVVSRVESDEYCEIANLGGVPQSLSGWHLNAGDPGQDYWFGDYTLEAGQHCRIYTNESHPEWDNLSYGRGSAIWNNKGDCGYLYDASGQLVSSWCY